MPAVRARASFMFESLRGLTRESVRAGRGEVIVCDAKCVMHRAAMRAGEARPATRRTGCNEP